MCHPSDGDLLAAFEARVAAAVRRCDELAPRLQAVERERQRLREGLRAFAAPRPGEDA